MTAAAAAAASAAQGAAPVAAPTFNKAVAPILFDHCASCHRPGEIAASQSLLSFDTAAPLGKAIKQQVLSGAMPPWPADPTRSMKFRNDRRLTKKDINTLVAWVDAGTPRGDAADLPPVPVKPPKWLHPQGLAPDAVLTLPEVSVSATGEIPYVQQRVKVPLAQDKWIVAMQVRPGDGALVHHMGITEVIMADGVSPADLDALAKVARQMGIADDALVNIRPAVVDSLNGTYDMLGVYTPGTTFEMYPDGSAKLLRAGSGMYINFNIHYTTTGTAEKNHSELALWFRPDAPTRQLFRAPAAVSTVIANGRQLLTDDPGTKAEGTDVAIPPIPPYADNFELIGLTAYVDPVRIYQLQPHAHMRGKDFTYSVVYPDGHEVRLLTVPKYDFHWQLAYDLETPLDVPAGSKMIVTAHYDNSSKNTHLTAKDVDRKNCGPDKEAYFRRQNQSWHEMFSPLIQYSVDRAKPVKGSLHIVEAVGCLNPGPENSWILGQASRPSTSQSQSTSASALQAMAHVKLGAGSYQLLGAAVFAPQRHGNQKMAVKGVLIPDAGQSRLNVTSLQMVAGNCL